MGWLFNREAPKGDSMDSHSFADTPFQEPIPTLPPKVVYPVVGEVVEHVERSFSQTVDPNFLTSITATVEGDSLSVEVQKYSNSIAAIAFGRRIEIADPESIDIPTSAIPELIDLLQTMQTVSSIKTKES